MRPNMFSLQGPKLRKKEERYLTRTSRVLAMVVSAYQTNEPRAQSKVEAGAQNLSPPPVDWTA